MSDSNPFQKQVDSIRERYAAELDALVKSFISGTLSLPAAASKANLPPPPTSKPAKDAKAKAAKAKPAAATKSPKRDPQSIEIIKDRIITALKTKQDQGIEDISKVLSIPTKDMRLPMQKLIAESRVSTQGEKRATKYRAK